MGSAKKPSFIRQLLMKEGVSRILCNKIKSVVHIFEKSAES